MKKLIFISFLLINGYFTFGQPIIEGIVVDELGEPMAGSNILEVGTIHGTVSDLQGRFILESKSQNPKISFQFIGYLDQELFIESDTSVRIHMKLDSSQWDEPLQGQLVCFFESRITKIGINSGLTHNQFGLEAQNIIPYIGPIRFNLNTDFKWRFLTEDTYLNIRLRRYDLFDIQNSLYVGLRAEYKSIEHSNNQKRIYSVSPEFAFNGYGISLGYARRSNEITETDNSVNGINVEFLKTYFGQLTIRAGTIYWQDDWQYLINITEHLPKTRFLIGAGWERIGNWEEFDVSLLYRFSY